MADSISKWESSSFIEDGEDREEGKEQGPAIRFDSSVLSATRPSLPRPLSLTSLSSRKTVEPNLALLPIFKTVSYKVDAEPIVSESKLDKPVQSFKQSTWHLQSIKDVARSLGTDKDKGLTNGDSFTVTAKWMRSAQYIMRSSELRTSKGHKWIWYR